VAADREPLPHQLNAMRARATCVGRDRELVQLDEWWRAARSGLRVVVVSGPAGIGKSLLVAVAAASMHGAGAAVRFGACTEASDRAYEPFLQALGAEVAGFLARGEGAFGLAREGLGRLFPASDHRALGDPIDPGLAHAAVLDALRACLTAASVDRPMVVVLEDVHWASSGTRDALASIARTGGAVPVLLVATARDDPTVGPEATRFIAELARLPVVDVVSLGGLDVDAAQAVIDAVGGDLDPTDAVRVTGGNPLFLREVARTGATSASLRTAVASRAAHLTADDLAVLDVAAAIGSDIGAALVAEALGRSLDEVLDGLERIEAAGLIGAGRVPGRFAFVHDVYRAVRYEGLGVGERMRLHAAVARALIASGGEPLADLARHACLAGPRFDPATAADLARRAGDAAAAATDFGAAIEHHRRALGALDLAPAPRPHDRIDLAIRLGGAQVLAGDPAGLPALRQIAEDARQRRHGVDVAAAFCAMSPLPGGSISVGDDEDHVTALGAAALELLPPHEERWRIRVLAALGMQLRMTMAGAEQRGETMIDDAVRAARRLDDPVVLGRVLLSWRFCGGPLDVQRRLACGHELVELGDRMGEQVLCYVGHQQLAWCHRELGDVDAMASALAESARRMTVPDLEQVSLDACAALLAGDLAGADTITRHLKDVTPSATMASGYTEPLRLAIDELRGGGLRREQAEAMAANLDGLRRFWWEAALARLLARTGLRKRAAAMLAAAADRQFEPRYAPHRSTSIGSCWAEVALLCSDADAGAEIARWYEPLAHHFVDSGSAVVDTVDRVRALALVAAGDIVAAQDVATDAVRRSRARRTPILLGRELVALAAARQHAAGGIADTLDEAAAIAQRTGARIILDDVRLFIGQPATDTSGLTGRERQVMDEVRRGATNDQIARTLGISPATVRTHLEHVYAKLGVSTRTAAVARLTDLEPD
jgi:DNA-binding CsgD family transcriptional regulator